MRQYNEVLEPLLLDDELLLPCPGCGRIPINAVSAEYGDNAPYFEVRCYHDGVGSMAYVRGRIRKEVISAWNRYAEEKWRERQVRYIDLLWSEYFRRNIQ